MRRALLAFVPVAFQACSSSRATTPPVTDTFGVFQVTVWPDSSKLTIAGPDGAALVDGIGPSADVGTPVSNNDDAPPMTGFAVREVSTSYQMLFGAFNITDTPNAPWRVASGAHWTGGSDPVELVDGNGSRLATLAFASDDLNHLVVDVEPGDGPERRFSWGFRCNAEDHFLGFGEQTWGTDARGETIPIWVQEEGVHKDLTTDDATGAWELVGRRHSAYMPMPEFLSSRGFMAVAQTDAISTFSMCGERDDIARMQLEMPVRVHLFYGPKPADAVSRKTAVFGRPRVPPAFAFAPWNDAIFGSANVRRVAKELRDNGIPSSVIWTEDWRGGNWVQTPGMPDRYALKEEWEVDRSLYPDFESVAIDLHGEGFKWLVYFNSFVEKTSKAWPETAPKGYLIKGKDGQPLLFGDATFTDTSLVDLSNPDAVKWTVGKLQAAMALGADGWMGDYGEWLPTDALLAGGTGLALHNLYPVLWQQAQRQALDTFGDSDERLSFVRSGWFGTPQLADVFWPGDQQTDWGADDGIPTIVPTAIGAALSGISTFGSDIAGYQNTNSPTSSKELFFRWTELGAFSPVMRTHHGTQAKTNWSFESDAETMAHWARYAKLHIALAPYLRTLAQQAHDTGIAIMRPLVLGFPGDGTLWPVKDEYLLGPSLLVAPVLTQGATSRSVTLPGGTWYPWTSGAPVTTNLTADAPVGEIPVYALAGTVVPTYPDGVQTLTVETSGASNASNVGDDRIVYAFAGQDGGFAEAYGGPSFTLTMKGTATGAPSATYDGTPLASCGTVPAAPCAQVNAEGVRAYVTGAGTLALSRGGASLLELIVATKSPAASYQLLVRY